MNRVLILRLSLRFFFFCLYNINVLKKGEKDLGLDFNILKLAIKWALLLGQSTLSLCTSVFLSYKIRFIICAPIISMLLWGSMIVTDVNIYLKFKMRDKIIVKYLKRTSRTCNVPFKSPKTAIYLWPRCQSYNLVTSFTQQKLILTDLSKTKIKGSMREKKFFETISS